MIEFEFRRNQILISSTEEPNPRAQRQNKKGKKGTNSSLLTRRTRIYTPTLTAPTLFFLLMQPIPPRPMFPFLVSPPPRTPSDPSYFSLQMRRAQHRHLQGTTQRHPRPPSNTFLSLMQLCSSLPVRVLRVSQYSPKRFPKAVVWMQFHLIASPCSLAVKTQHGTRPAPVPQRVQASVGSMPALRLWGYQDERK